MLPCTMKQFELALPEDQALMVATNLAFSTPEASAEYWQVRLTDGLTVQEFAQHRLQWSGEDAWGAWQRFTGALRGWYVASQMQESLRRHEAIPPRVYPNAITGVQGELFAVAVQAVALKGVPFEQGKAATELVGQIRARAVEGGAFGILRKLWDVMGRFVDGHPLVPSGSGEYDLLEAAGRLLVLRKSAESRVENVVWEALATAAAAQHAVEYAHRTGDVELEQLPSARLAFVEGYVAGTKLFARLELGGATEEDQVTRRVVQALVGIEVEPARQHSSALLQSLALSDGAFARYRQGLLQRMDARTAAMWRSARRQPAAEAAPARSF